jgi:hypothetical protein
MSGPTIIVEDGTIVTGANSYLSVAAIRSYASDRNITLNTSDAVVGGQIIAAMDWIEGNSHQWKGDLVQDGILPDCITGTVLPRQPLSWPRKYIRYYRQYWWPDNTIPSQVTKALSMLVMAISTGYDPMTNAADEDFVSSEKAGIYGTTYCNPLEIGALTRAAGVINVLQPLFADGRGPFQIQTGRV